MKGASAHMNSIGRSGISTIDILLVTSNMSFDPWRDFERLMLWSACIKV